MTSLGQAMGAAAVSLLLVFAASLLPALLSVQLLEPKWQQTLAGLLIGNAPLALVALILLHLAVVVSPEESTFRQRRDRFSRWAALATLGYLLLLPLQISATSRVFGGESRDSAQQLATVLARIDQRRQATEAATGPEDLQRRLVAVGSPPLPPNALSRPLPELKAQMLAVLQQAENQARTQFRPPGERQTTLRVAQLLRDVISTLALAMGFAAFSRRRRASRPLLEEARQWCLPLHRWRLWQRRAGGPGADADYFDRLSQSQQEEP
ncbi:hypothetical protein [Synechococcus sp. CCY 9618]|uniref:hypothetical protein n=1 Tax=Synechococcus sp. CCY 9618 TaxID=2815602 RepID=UPI001C24359E|nr:hypothetical protein [Synechococcus sp. CCY 9618]